MKWQTLTKSNQARYPLPQRAQVLGVSYCQQDTPIELPMLFVAQQEIPFWHVSGINGRPESADELRDMLERVYDVFGAPCWAVFEDCLIIWPPAINDGDVLTVELGDAD